jgi:hypothetical protein
VQAIYLYFNAFLYVVFALWCTLAPENTATNIGFTRLTSGGRSEYLVVYGGLQAGLALIFFILARAPDRHRLGILISVALYAPLVVYRITTVLRFWPVSIVTLATGALEIVLLVVALGILVSEA